jgi:hypothetical protein
VDTFRGRQRLDRKNLTVLAYPLEGDRFCRAERFTACARALGDRSMDRAINSPTFSGYRLFRWSVLLWLSMVAWPYAFRRPTSHLDCRSWPRRAARLHHSRSRSCCDDHSGTVYESAPRQCLPRYSLSLCDSIRCCQERHTLEAIRVAFWTNFKTSARSSSTVGLDRRSRQLIPR